jgi:glyoxylase-like metal-dependent hydrolase (beta-lactamase superfamily II)
MGDVPRQVTPRITLLGSRESCIYLVDGGSETALVEGGMAYVAPHLVQQIEDLGIDETRIKRLMILHSHFDHCGLVPFLKRRWPWAVVSGSARARQLLSDPKVTERIKDLNQAMISRARLEDEARRLGFGFTRVEVEEILKDGDEIACGDVTLKVIDVPGHSSCSIALYVPEEKALFVSDAAGVRHKDFFLPTGNSDYDLYQASLEKMAGYDVDAILPGHFEPALGEEARAYLTRAIEDSKAARKVLESSYRRTRDVERSTEELVRAYMAKAPMYFLSEDVFTVIIGQMMRFIAKSMGDEPGPRR